MVSQRKLIPRYSMKNDSLHGNFCLVEGSKLCRRVWKNKLEICISFIVIFSVADPFHFDMDPAPDSDPDPAPYPTCKSRKWLVFYFLFFYRNIFLQKIICFCYLWGKYLCPPLNKSLMFSRKMYDIFVILVDFFVEIFLDFGYFFATRIWIRIRLAEMKRT